MNIQQLTDQYRRYSVLPRLLLIGASPKVGYKSTYQGSALTEVVVLMLVMVPLAFTIPMLGKLIDLKQSSIQASRYLAWQQTHAPSQSGDAQSRVDDLNRRFFSSPDAAIASAAGNVANQPIGENPLWGRSGGNRSAGQYQGMWDGLGFADDVAIDLQQTQSAQQSGELPTIAAATSRSIDATTGFVEALSGANWDVEANGMVSVNVAISAHLGGLLNSASSTCGDRQSINNEFCLEIGSAILTDGWSASSSEQAKDRTQTFVPATILEPAGKFLSAFGNLPVLKELKPLDDAFGRVDTEVLPLDRYEEN